MFTVPVSASVQWMAFLSHSLKTCRVLVDTTLFPGQLNILLQGF